MILAYTTCPPDKAKELANALLDKGLIACANILSSQSVYVYKTEKKDEEESVILLKTTKDRITELRRAVDELHPYELPCFITLDVEASEAFGKWVHERTHAMEHHKD